MDRARNLGSFVLRDERSELCVAMCAKSDQPDPRDQSHGPASGRGAKSRRRRAGAVSGRRTGRCVRRSGPSPASENGIELEAHFAACERCQQVLAALGAALGSAGRRIRRPSCPRLSRRLRRPWPPIAAALAVVAQPRIRCRCRGAAVDGAASRGTAAGANRRRLLQSSR